MDQLPYELNMIIFSLVLFSEPTNDPHVLYDLREKIMATYSGWFRLFMGEPKFWSYIIVTRTSSPLAALTYIQRSENTALRFHLVFNNHGTNSVPRAITHEINIRLHPLKPFFERTLHMYIESDNDRAMLRLHEHFTRTYAPLLKHLTLNYTYNLRGGRRGIDKLNLQTKAWFGGKMAALEELRLETISMPFERMYLPALRYVALTSSLGRIQIEARSISALLKEHILLQEVYLGGAGINGSMAENIRSTSVVALSVIFSRDGSSPSLLSRLDFPNLRIVALHLECDLDLAEATSCWRTFSKATTMRVTTGASCMLSVSFRSGQLFDRMSQIQTLDLGDCRGNLFRLLLELSEKSVTDNNTTTLPKLQNVSLPLIETADIKRFVTIHNRLLKISAKTYNHYGPVTEKTQADREWIARRVDDFTLQRQNGQAGRRQRSGRFMAARRDKCEGETLRRKLLLCTGLSRSVRGIDVGAKKRLHNAAARQLGSPSQKERNASTAEPVRKDHRGSKKERDPQLKRKRENQEKRRCRDEKTRRYGGEELRNELLERERLTGEAKLDVASTYRALSAPGSYTLGDERRDRRISCCALHRICSVPPRASGNDPPINSDTRRVKWLRRDRRASALLLLLPFTARQPLVKLLCQQMPPHLLHRLHPPALPHSQRWSEYNPEPVAGHASDAAAFSLPSTCLPTRAS
ncbi:hypothetical protein B0H11DRAFT_1912171 [Mycena galericulata]|nr:hypothetical protein B0H11DRAFT_1912171 [Mycena galericulata]